MFFDTSERPALSLQSLAGQKEQAYLYTIFSSTRLCHVWLNVQEHQGNQNRLAGRNDNSQARRVTIMVHRYCSSCSVCLRRGRCPMRDQALRPSPFSRPFRRKDSSRLGYFSIWGTGDLRFLAESLQTTRLVSSLKPALSDSCTHGRGWVRERSDHVPGSG